MIKAQTLKGFRDFLPQDAKKRQYVIDQLKSVFASYGFVPLETPALEYEEVLLGKYGEEGDKLLYRFTDNGERKVALRYDQTVPLSRVVAQYQNDLPAIFKRYQIQPVWRAENTQKGRFREFLQCDIDITGTDSPLSDAEILAVIADSYKAFGFTNPNTFTILVNDRQNFSDIPTKAITIIDKLNKVGPEEVRKELQEKGFDPSLLEQVEQKKVTENLQRIIKQAEQLGVDKNIITYSPTLARGLDYYTGIIIEVTIGGYTVGSVGGGGRYDKLIGMFAGKEIPAVGFAFGFDRIIEAMEEKGLFPKDLLSTQVLVTIFSSDLQEQSMKVALHLREKNIRTELYLDEHAKMEKQIKYADHQHIPYVIIIGPEEAEKHMVTLKNMQTREQAPVPLEELPSLVR